MLLHADFCFSPSCEQPSGWPKEATSQEKRAAMSRSSRWDTEQSWSRTVRWNVPGTAQRPDVSPQGELPGSGARTRGAQGRLCPLPWSELQGREGPVSAGCRPALRKTGRTGCFLKGPSGEACGLRTVRLHPFSWVWVPQRGSLLQGLQTQLHEATSKMLQGVESSPPSD